LYIELVGIKQLFDELERLVVDDASPLILNEYVTYVR